MFSDDDVRRNRTYFEYKLRGEKQKTSAVKKVREGVGDFLLIDARPRDAFAHGHVPGAWCIPLDEVEHLAPLLPRDRELVTYCWSHF